MQCYSVAYLPWRLAVLLASLIAFGNSQTYCSGTQYLSASSGEIVSHSGAGTTWYQSSMACYWQVTAPTGSVIAAQITYADFETCYNTCDYVSIYDGSFGSTSLITKVSDSSGYVSPRFTSSSSTMWVYFYTNFYTTALGFRLSYTMFNSLTSSSSCGEISYRDASYMSGVVTSHVTFGSASYSPSMTCLRTLPKRSGYTVSLSVTTLSLGSRDCLRLPTNSVNISSSSSHIAGSNMYCGSYTLSSALTIDADDGAQIVFSSDGQTESTGFSIRFEYVALIERNFSLSNESGEIMSHSGVGVTPYSNNLRYLWRINAPSGRVVSVKFTYISLQSPNDAIGVYDSSGALLAAVTGSSLGSYLSRTLTSSSEVMIVRFRTDSSGAGFGFRLQFSTTAATSGSSGSGSGRDSSQSTDSSINTAVAAGSAAGVFGVILCVIAAVIFYKCGCGALGDMCCMAAGGSS